MFETSFEIGLSVPEAKVDTEWVVDNMQESFDARLDTQLDGIRSQYLNRPVMVEGEAFVGKAFAVVESIRFSDKNEIIFQLGWSKKISGEFEEFTAEITSEEFVACVDKAEASRVAKANREAAAVTVNATVNETVNETAEVVAEVVPFRRGVQGGAARSRRASGTRG